MKCILLVRVSTERQNFDAQMEELYQLAIKDGYQDNDIIPIAEKESGIKLKEEERIGLNKLKELVATNEFNCVYAWEISRIARTKKVLFSITEYLISRHIQLVIKEPYIKLLNEDGSINDNSELTISLYAQLAEAEMRNKKARFKRAKEDGFAKGKFQGGRITRGYKVNADGYWEIEEDEAAFIRLIFNLYINESYSMSTLAQELLSRGYFYKRVGDTKSQLSTTMAKAEIYQILRNPRYLGGQQAYITGNKNRTNHNNYPAIIDIETWKIAEQKRARNRQAPKDTTVFLLTPIIRCKCGASYIGNIHDGSYECRVRHNAIEKGIEHSPSISANLIESLVWYIALLELESDRAGKAEEMKVRNEEEIATLQKKIVQSEQNLKLFRTRQERLVYEFYSGLHSEELFDNLSRTINNKIRDENTNLKSYNARIKYLEDLISDSHSFDELLEKIRGHFLDIRSGMDTHAMRQIIRRYINEIQIFPHPTKSTNHEKIVKITLNNEERHTELLNRANQKGLESLAIKLGTTFYVDSIHKEVYYDEGHCHIVPLTLLNRIVQKRKDNRHSKINKK